MYMICFVIGFVLVLLGVLVMFVFVVDDVVNLMLKDYKFLFDGVMIFVGKKVKFVVKNFDVMLVEFESDDFKVEKVVLVGKLVEILVGLLKVGIYEFYDEYYEV